MHTSPMVFLAGFLLPLACYLLALGLINRRSYPLVVSGVWDFIALLGAVAGFLLLGGPLIIERLAERLVLGWLAHPRTGEETITPVQLKLLLGAIYFVVVAGGTAFLLARQRHFTSIYNVDLEQLEEALEEAFGRRGLQPLRSGRTFFFRAADAVEGAAPAAVLELEPFGAFRHVTLRWDPATGPMRVEVEEELARHLADSPTEPGEVSFWLTLAGLFLFGLALIGAVAHLVLTLT